MGNVDVRLSKALRWKSTVPNGSVQTLKSTLDTSLPEVNKITVASTPKVFHMAADEVHATSPLVVDEPFTEHKDLSETDSKNGASLASDSASSINSEALMELEDLEMKVPTLQWPEEASRLSFEASIGSQSLILGLMCSFQANWKLIEPYSLHHNQSSF